MAQRLMNPTRNHEVAGLIPGLDQWIKDLVEWFKDRRCLELWG